MESNNTNGVLKLKFFSDKNINKSRFYFENLNKFLQDQRFKISFSEKESTGDRYICFHFNDYTDVVSKKIDDSTKNIIKTSIESLLTGFDFEKDDSCIKLIIKKDNIEEEQEFEDDKEASDELNSKDKKRKICFRNLLVNIGFNKDELIKEEEIDSIGAIKENRVKNTEANQNNKSLKFDINCIVEFLMRLIKWIFVNQEKFNNAYKIKTEKEALKELIEKSDHNFLKKLSLKIAFNDCIDSSIKKNEKSK